MAMLRNREVKIDAVASEIDGSTFHVRYPEGETEIAKLHELSFTRSEYESFVRPLLPEVQIIDEPSMTSVEVTKKK